MEDRQRCCPDCTDFSDITDSDLGCCGPMVVRRDCRAPTLVVPDCDEADPVVTYDPEEDAFTVETVLYDVSCSPITDVNGSQFLTFIR